jgi:hypothetical protein
MVTDRTIVVTLRHMRQGLKLIHESDNDIVLIIYADLNFD